MDKASKGQKPKASNPTEAKLPPPAKPPGRVPPLFRRIDWLTMLITFAVIWTIYFLTLAPEVTLQDSGELCTGAFYAGIPHPPGYPFWTIYSWLWTKLLPFGNVAWRVEVGEATAAALACGLVALMVSRGSSMLMEGIEGLRSITGSKWESGICAISGAVAGLMLGLGSVMWSESVAINRISLFGVPWLMIVLVCLLRWMYAPHQLRYLYWAMFFFGICATIHQTLLVASMGIEVAVCAVRPKLGRYMFLGNAIIWLMGLIAQSTGVISMLDPNSTAFMVLFIFNAVGVLSLLAYIWFAIRTQETFKELCQDAALAAFMLLSVTAITQGIFFGLLAILALGAFLKLSWDTRKMGLEWLIVLVLGLLWVAGASFYFYEPIAGMTDPPMMWGYPRTVTGFFHALSRGQYERANPTNVFMDPTRFLMQLGLLIGDISHEFNWVCIFIAVVPLLFYWRMQKRERCWIVGLSSIYLCIGVLLIILMNPSAERQSAVLIQVFFTSSHAVVAILFGYGIALIAAYMATHYKVFRPAGLLLGGVTVVPALITLYNGVDNTFHGGDAALTPTDVLYLFFCLAACFILAALAARHYLRYAANPTANASNDRLYFLTFSVAALVCMGASIALAFFSKDTFGFDRIWTAIPRIFDKDQYSLPVIAGLLVLAMSVCFLVGLAFYRHRAPLMLTLAIFTLLPLASGLDHWANSEKRGHWFGYWYGHDMFKPPFDGKNGKPIYPTMARNAILFGGTDPGRFCPTYMIFCESFIPHSCQAKLDQHFDRRDVYLITQNALADGTYLDYLRAQYFRSHQHDPPFFSELVRTIFKDKPYQTNLLARMVSPLDTFFEARGARIEKRWRVYTSWFNDKSFTNFTDFVSKLRVHQDPVSKWLFDNLSKNTQNLIVQHSDETQLRPALIADLNHLLQRGLNERTKLKKLTQERDSVDEQLAEGSDSKSLAGRDKQLAKEIAAIHLDPLYTPQRFAHVKITEYLQRFINQNPQGDTLIRLNRLLLEAAYPHDIVKSLSGVYPDREIYIPSNEDSQRCFSEYIKDATRRAQMHELRPGEDVHIGKDGRVQVSGQVAVMAINGLLTKVIFNQNPHNQFYVEESFPLDWMYSHLTPYGVIMKIHRKPIPQLSEAVVRRDHEFWTQYSNRLIGNWITYKTSVKDIVAWIKKVYLEHNYKGFTGDRRFIRDSEAQKAFSKLRSSIAGIYAWRLGLTTTGAPTPSQYLPQTEAERKRMIKEADFAFRQAFAFCPYSPEAVFRYVNFLMSQGRLSDALLVANTCHKLDPENTQVVGMIKQLEGYKNHPNSALKIQNDIRLLHDELRTNPDDFQKSFALASKYMQIRQPARADQVLDEVLNNPHAQVGVVLAVAQAYAQMNNLPKLELALEKYVKLAPSQPEAWYDLAAAKAALGRTNDAMKDLSRSLELNAKRLAKNPKAHDLRSAVEKDPRFAALRNTPAYKALMATNH